jgi:hypothetical protein
MSVYFNYDKCENKHFIYAYPAKNGEVIGFRPVVHRSLKGGVVEDVTPNYPELNKILPTERQARDFAINLFNDLGEGKGEAVVKKWNKHTHPVCAPGNNRPVHIVSAHYSPLDQVIGFYEDGSWYLYGNGHTLEFQDGIWWQYVDFPAPPLEP